MDLHQCFSTKGRFRKMIYALRQTICALRPTFEKLFTGAKVQHKGQKISVGRQTVYEIDPVLEYPKAAHSVTLPWWLSGLRHWCKFN